MRQHCKECKKLGIGGASICDHNHKRSTCKECKKLGIGGNELCDHYKLRCYCVECGGGGICEHSIRRTSCKKCNGFVRLARTMYHSAKVRAKKKKLPFDLTVDDILKLIGDGTCPVFNTPFEMESGLSKASASLDRFKPELGYVKGNCSVISYLANAMKQGATADEIQRLADWVRQKELNK